MRTFSPLLASIILDAPHADFNEKLSRRLCFFKKNQPFFWKFSPSTPLTLVVGENGSGKTTLLESIAVKMGLCAKGGENYRSTDTEREASILSAITFLEFSTRGTPNGFFIRADSADAALCESIEKEKLLRENIAYIHSLPEEKKIPALTKLAACLHRDSSMKNRHWLVSQPIKLAGEDGWRRYGEQSRGEGVLGLLNTLVEPSERKVYLLDEPETGLSPRRQMALFRMIDDIVQDGRSQAIIATHSPILMSHPKAEILWIDEKGIDTRVKEEVEHWRDMGAFMRNPERMVQTLLEE